MANGLICHCESTVQDIGIIPQFRHNFYEYLAHVKRLGKKKN